MKSHAEGLLIAGRPDPAYDGAALSLTKPASALAARVGQHDRWDTQLTKVTAMVTRRDFLGGLLAGSFSGVLSRVNGHSAGTQHNDEPVTTELLDGSQQAAAWLEQAIGPTIGQLQVRDSQEIGQSRFSVGLETLDRAMFDPERVFVPLGRLGVKWARLQTGWARCEQSPGDYDFAWLDRVVNGVREVGVTPWFNLGYGNRLYTPEAPDASAVGWILLNGRTCHPAWLKFVEALARHFQDRVKHWEIWNEPNIKGFWKPIEPSAELYAAFVKETAAVIRGVIPDVTIIGGALAGMPTDYLRSLLAHGMAQHVDKISFHPYRAVPEQGYRETLESWRQLIRQNAEKTVELWQGENGCPSRPGSAGALGQYGWTETSQAKWLLRRMLYDRVLDLELTSYFHMVDLVNYNWGAGPSGKTNFKGLLRGEDYSPKPSYFAYQRLCTLFDGSAQREPSLDAMVKLEEPRDKGTLARDVEQWREQQILAGFVRNGQPLWCLWFAGDLLKPAVLRRLTLRIDFAGDLAGQMCAIDLLSGKIFQVHGLERRDSRWVLPSLPVADYPLILTVREALVGVVTWNGTQR